MKCGGSSQSNETHSKEESVINRQTKQLLEEETGSLQGLKLSGILGFQKEMHNHRCCGSSNGVCIQSWPWGCRRDHEGESIYHLIGEERTRSEYNTVARTKAQDTETVDKYLSSMTKKRE